MQDELLVSRAKLGDRDALDQLFRLYYPMLKKFLIKTTRDESMAEDLSQDTVLKAILNLKTYQPQAKFSTWLITIAMNLYRNQLRRKGTVTMETIPETPASDNVEEQVWQDYRHHELAKLIQTLPEEKRQVFILKHYQGLSYEEIASIVHCPIGTVRSRLHDSLLFLRKELKRRELDCS
jgi:RNA polymerase sigma-70 factor (ECF subfamily)